jgi:hypothetical protein
MLIGDLDWDGVIAGSDRAALRAEWGVKWTESSRRLHATARMKWADADAMFVVLSGPQAAA